MSREERRKEGRKHSEPERKREREREREREKERGSEEVGEESTVSQRKQVVKISSFCNFTLFHINKLIQGGQ
jgi:hypothetical protein